MKSKKWLLYLLIAKVIGCAKYDKVFHEIYDFENHPQEYYFIFDKKKGKKLNRYKSSVLLELNSDTTYVKGSIKSVENGWSYFVIHDTLDTDTLTELEFEQKYGVRIWKGIGGQNMNGKVMLTHT